MREKFDKETAYSSEMTTKLNDAETYLFIMWYMCMYLSRFYRWNKEIEGKLQVLKEDNEQQKNEYEKY